MIDPLKDELVLLLLNGIRHDRLSESGSEHTGSTHFQADSTIKGKLCLVVKYKPNPFLTILNIWYKIFIK